MSENNEKAAEQTAKPAPKKSMTRGRIVAAVVVAVIIVAGCGMFAWHNTPQLLRDRVPYAHEQVRCRLRGRPG